MHCLMAQGVRESRRMKRDRAGMPLGLDVLLCRLRLPDFITLSGIPRIGPAARVPGGPVPWGDPKRAFAAARPRRGGVRVERS